ncbi:putative methylcrotonoyl-CoA carboxylase beta chain [Colletotrichum aenigma]|uniref:putative methylcrotonoyl-CoA carboxylase beta chain n=1 Tax=Colletotrichum aenigma TaxID=1215731 RepID=UPI0018726CA9|nr:putative methylcrotonoyl-CoA carboxylase beta chain [Colletotrichum aenigma]KAF5518217.1 putative methylcrotonoyl-CoA carboxylase beta chain [Colletotrichum aenigma]
MAQPFPVEKSVLDLGAPNFQENRSQWEKVLAEFDHNLRQVSSEGDDVSTARHQGRGQLLQRDRINLLLDAESPFLELGAFAGFRNADSNSCGNLIAGIGLVSGRPCIVMSHIPTQSGGAWNEITVHKVNRILEVGFENDLPLISLVQSAGVFLPQQFRVFHKGGQLFRDLAIRSKHGKPSCAVVFGPSTAGGAYHPALSDYTIFVENQAQVFLGGPPLVKMATSETVTTEELGGAKVHGTVTGLADHTALDEFDAIQKAREWVATLNPLGPSHQGGMVEEPLPPRYPVEDLLSIVNTDIRKPFDMREVLLRIVDDSRLSIFKPGYGVNMLTAWADILGFRVGIVANQTPVIHPQEALKAAQFIRLCNQEVIPIVFLHNVTGFMVGTKAEHAGIIKAGAQLVSAVSCSSVPHISIILGASYGAGNYAIVMGPDQLAGVMETIKSKSNGGSKLSTEQIKAQAQKVHSYSPDKKCRDALSQHVADAHESVCIGSIEHDTKNPFLNIDLLLRTALEAHADAVHPGYGYLSENADFADRVRAAGLTFVGPTGQTISTLGDKRTSKEYLRTHAPEVPLIPGFSGSSQNVEDLQDAATRIGFPVMLKASAGGGGKGMRVVRKASQLQSELDRAQSESQRSFGSSDCILEKFIESSKHVEIQIVGDQHGNVVSLFERDCSIQRRNQKVIEETPCLFLDEQTKKSMSDTAVKIGKLLGYEGAGTVEFVVDTTTKKFYFLEVNTRLQVEHPITEEVVGVDLVSLQLYVAAGGRLADVPELSALTQTGHAIESQ